MKGHRPTLVDVQRLQEALSLVASYDAGADDGDFAIFGAVVDDVEHPKAVIQGLTQLAWLFLRSMEETGPVERENVMAWYGKQFAEAVEELSGES